MPAFKILPFRQGHLDGLCGLYSIVNALRFSLLSVDFIGPSRRRSRRLTRHEAELLFLCLLNRLLETKSHARHLVEGVDPFQLAKLIKHTDTWLRERRDLALTAVKPFASLSKVSNGTLLRSLQDHLTLPGAAAIIGTTGEWEHWTVATKVTAARLYLLDSGGDTSIASKRGKRRLRYHVGLVDPTCLFLLKLRAQPRRRR